MTNQEAIMKAVKEWMSESTEVVEKSLRYGAELAAGGIVTHIRESFDKWLDDHTELIVSEVSKQIALKQIAVPTGKAGDKDETDKTPLVEGVAP